MLRDENTAPEEKRRRSPLLVAPAICVALLCATLFCATAAPAAEHRLGVGVLYWETVDELLEEFEVEDDGVGLVASYQYVPKGLFRFEVDLEFYSDGYGASRDSAVSPVGYVIVGSFFYVAMGGGVTISSGLKDDVSDPFFAARTGLQFRVLPGLRLDVNANYRTNVFDELNVFDFETDTWTVGAFVRFNL